ncbi:hypothetical protein KIPB_005059 [Kipferlia bialata]|uniref:Metallo-beta-lactamase domain-containing protein n=1 Tax=Kipferlia bialata TaxID=797122 RepID=A0A9K3CVG5_9EUKA|nr:hypothetical protein KIPB_005059 [Kipferlia bialata]|eukprot:g5059.t1
MLNGSIMVEAGISTWRSPKAVLITHRHTDHSAALCDAICPRSAIKKGQEHLKGRPVYAPAEAIPMLAQLCTAYSCLSTGKLPVDPFASCGMHEMPVSIGDTFTIPGIPDVVVEVVKCYHTCECVGYGFSILKRRLNPKYRGLDKQGLIALKKSGTDITETVTEPQVIFFGDTTPDALFNHTEWQKYPNVFIECTACKLNGEDLQLEARKRRERGHTHVVELKELIERHSEGRRWFLQHTSAACTPEELRIVRESIQADVVIVE